MRNYQRIGRNGRPVLNISEPVIVGFCVGIIQMELDEKNNMLELSTWTRYTWYDNYLVWDPSAFHGIEEIRIQADSIWTPDIMLYNTADVNLSTREVRVVVDYRGRVNWYPHTLYRSSCLIDVTNFPFDEQQCSLMFGSWTYNSKQVDLRMAIVGGIDFESFVTVHKSAWDLVNHTSERTFQPSADVNPNYVVLTFNVTMHRKRVFSSYILTLPCVFLACLTLVVFWLPADRPDRTSLAMSIFSSFMVLLLILVETAPPATSSIPTLGIYYCFNLVIIMFAVILSSLVVNVSRGCSFGTQAPHWLHLIVGRGLATIVLLRHRTPTRHNSCRTDGNGNQRQSLSSCRDACSVLPELVMRQAVMNGAQLQHCETTPLNPYETKLTSLDDEMRHMRRVIRQLELKMEAEAVSASDEVHFMREWRFLAIVLDRFFFTLYFFLIVFSLAWLFPRV